jgi:hypothetical protein
MYGLAVMQTSSSSTIMSLINKIFFFQVGLAFCTLYNFTYRTTWCVFPFTLIAMCWSKLLSQCRCSRCGVLCCKKRKTLAKLTKFQSEKSPVQVVPESAPQPVTELLQIRANRLTTNNSFQRESRYVIEFLLWKVKINWLKLIEITVFCEWI